MIKLVILDVDGVMTDGKKYYDRDGNVVMKTSAIKIGQQSNVFVLLESLLYF